jgi:hypothetical protein
MAARNNVMRALAVLFGLLAVSNCMKPVAQAMAPGGPEGLVFFGHRLHGVANAILGPLFGLVLGAYAYGIWTAKRWIVPLATAYALYVPLNLVLFMALQASDAEKGRVVFNVVYTIVAIGVSAGAALYFRRNRHLLG